PTGAGNPRWIETHGVPEADAEAVARLRAAGASLVGKTITDELAWSLNGSNAHYGTPENPAAPGRLPGGSSSGSASAVALGLADIGLGTDTGGSIRVPASYCGLFGLRPSHGRVPLDGVVPLSASFDTAGVITRDAETLRTASAALLGKPRRPAPIARILAPRDVWEAARTETRAVLAPAVERLASALGVAIDRAPLFEDADELERARVTYTTIQAYEAWQTHGAWIEASSPEFGPGVAARFANAARLTEDDRDRATRHRERVADLLGERLAGGAALALPAAPGPAPMLDQETHGGFDALDREAIVRLTCPAGLSGAPAVALPAGEVTGLPLGLQLVVSPGSDEALLEAAVAFAVHVRARR
ncbi:amidase family protein, partial [Glycomyces tenuis]|uniref:amidase family protein n=1 Tax=Glycomyces tenuis TaxID=58116 RepID=UPI00068E050B